MNLNKKEKGELMYGEIFTRYLAMAYGLKYRAVLREQSGIKPLPTYADVDVILEPLSTGQFPLFLQLRFDIKPERAIFKDPITKKDTILFSGCEIDLSIRKKESKYLNQKRDVGNIILLIQGSWSIDEVGGLINPCKYTESRFRGIYYVSPKTKIIGEAVGRTEGWDEFVIPIKEFH